MRDVQRKAAAAPKAEDFASEAGATVVEDGKGNYTATVRGAENIKRAVEMQNAARKIEVERGTKLRLRKPTENIVTPEGKTFAFPAHLIEQVADKRGWKPAGRRGGAVMRFTGGWPTFDRDGRRTDLVEG